MRKQGRTTFFILALIFSASTFAQKAILMLPVIKAEVSQVITVPVTVTTDSLITFAQFVVEYNANVLRFDHAENGRDAVGFALLVQPNLPFSPTAPGTNANVLAQISSAVQNISGSKRGAVNFYFKAIGAAGDSSVLVFDAATNHTVLSTRSGKDIFGSDLTFVNGVVRVIGLLSYWDGKDKNGIPVRAGVYFINYRRVVT